MSEIWSKEEEVRRLQERFDTLKAKKISQASFAREHDMPGGASMITQHLKATRPISMEHALVYARGFACQLAEISPRLAKLVAEGQATVTGSAQSTLQISGSAIGHHGPTSTLLANLQDWRLQASSKSQEVIDNLTLLAKKNKLRDEDWQLIDQMVHRFMNR